MSQSSKMLQLTISSACNACGLCFSSCSCIEETPEGKALPKGTGAIPADLEKEIKKIISECPAHAISFQVIASKNADEIRQMIKTQLIDFSPKKPERNDLLFNPETIQVPMAFSPHEYQYNYSSYNRAKEAAKDEINRLMFSQRKTIIENILVQYKNEKLRPYYLYEQTKDNFYYTLECQASLAIQKIIDQIKAYNPAASIPSDMAQISIRPDKNDIFIENFTKNWFEERNASQVLSELSGEYYSLNFYADQCDIDDTEMYAGTGMFGREKYETKYCFKNTQEAFREITKDIKGACSSVISSETVDDAYSMICGVVDTYTKKLHNELLKKAQELEALL